MANDIPLPGVSALPASSKAASAPKTTVSSLPQPPAAKRSVIVNPTLRLDPALGLVVIEFRNDSGAITTSIPSQRQLEAYQRWAVAQLGPEPARTQQVLRPREPAGVNLSDAATQSRTTQIRTTPGTGAD
jgi:hypothetical protein